MYTTLTLQNAPREVLLIIYNMLPGHTNGLPLTCKHTASALLEVRNAAINEDMQQYINPYMRDILAIMKSSQRSIKYTRLCQRIAFMMVGEVRCSCVSPTVRSIHIYLRMRVIWFVYNGQLWLPTTDVGGPIRTERYGTRGWARIMGFIERYVPVLYRELTVCPASVLTHEPTATT